MLGPMLDAGNTKRCRLIPGGDGQLICAITGWGVDTKCSKHTRTRGINFA